MNDIEKKLRGSRIIELGDIDNDEFLYKLDIRIKHGRENMRTFVVSVFMSFFIVLSSILHNDSKYNNDTVLSHILNEESIFGTDIWNINFDYSHLDQGYYGDLTYHLLEEDYPMDVYGIFYELIQLEEM